MLPRWHLSLHPRVWQSHALERWIDSGHRGVVSVVTGGGKTTFAYLCIREIVSKAPRARIVIIVPTLALLDQWHVSLQEDFHVSEKDIGCISSQEKTSLIRPISLIVLNSARTIAPSFTREPTFLIVDECHRAGSPENAKALNGTHIATLGLSATPIRDYDDGFSANIRPAIGDIIYEYTYSEALADRVITEFHLVNVRVRLLSDEERNYRKLTQAVVRAYRASVNDGSDDRLRTLLQRRAQISSSATMRIPVTARLTEEHQGQRTIVFHERIAAAEQLRSILVSRKHLPTCYHSRLEPATRRDNLKLFRRGVFDSLITCRALDEGLNVPDASVAIISSSTASRRQRIQRLGRVLRPSSGKDSAVIYTLFATDAERDRLETEATRLQGMTSIEWRDASYT